MAPSKRGSLFPSGHPIDKIIQSTQKRWKALLKRKWLVHAWFSTIRQNLRKASHAVNLESKQKRNSRLFSPGILRLGPATRSAWQGARPVKPGEHSPRTGVWQGDRGAAGLAGVAQRDRVLGGRHGAGRMRERRETQGWQGMKETQGKTGAKLEKDTGQAGCRAGGRHSASRTGRRHSARRCWAGGRHGADRVPSWRRTRGWQGGRVPRGMEARGKHGGDTM